MSAGVNIIVDPLKWPLKGLANPPFHMKRLRLVAASASEQLWRFCEPRELAQIVVYSRKEGPFCNFERDSKERIRIGLSTSLNTYSQQAYQFAHEFCHAIANHSRNGQRHDARHTNHWLEESFCEAASLFSLRRMAEEWAIHKEFSKWTTDDRKAYAPSLKSYAQGQLNKAHAKLPLNKDFREWFEGEEKFMRDHPIATVDIEKDKPTWDKLREAYTVIASRLLLLLEAGPENWEALSYLHLTPHRDAMPLAEHLADWKAVCPDRLKPFVEDLERLFLPPIIKVEDAA